MALYETPFGIVSPVYSIHKYNDSTYKIIRYKGARGLAGGYSRKEDSTEKLASSVSRAKSTVLEYALCNEWKYFVTFTLDPQKYDRFDLHKFRKDLTQWIRDLRKSSGYDIQFLFVPEQHKKGGWHFHGLLSAVPNVVSFKSLAKSGVSLPSKLIKSDYLCWVDYTKRFGWCSLGEIKNLEATSFYLIKYISKDMASDIHSVGDHLYFCSRGLSRKTLHGEVYTHSSFLDQFLTNDYPYCKTGWTDKMHSPQNWDFAQEYLDYEPLFPPDPEPVVCDHLEKLVQITEKSFFGDKYALSYEVVL